MPAPDDVDTKLTAPTSDVKSKLLPVVLFFPVRRHRSHSLDTQEHPLVEREGIHPERVNRRGRESSHQGTGIATHEEQEINGRGATRWDIIMILRVVFRRGSREGLIMWP